MNLLNPLFKRGIQILSSFHQKNIKSKADEKRNIELRKSP